MTKNYKTLQGAAVKFGRLVSTTDQVLGTICFWINYELYEVTPEALAV